MLKQGICDKMQAHLTAVTLKYGNTRKKYWTGQNSRMRGEWLDRYYT